MKIEFILYTEERKIKPKTAKQEAGGKEERDKAEGQSEEEGIDG